MVPLATMFVFIKKLKSIVSEYNHSKRFGFETKAELIA